MNITYLKFCTLFLLTLFVFSSCEKLHLKEDVPECIETKIRKIQNEPTWDPPAEIWKWEVDGETYYYFSSKCCDQFNYLYNTECIPICAPDGGITGTGDGTCPFDRDDATFKLIWEDR